ncbi:unnamed protein product [Rotaria sordida]|uniref:Selenoprotein F n=2 Tax=Rotaria sordida TaxID=392033 RepID=A0A815E9U4_9BILA|nr:unnamed protein product [Rotaria sordida]CAF1354149.1 unnamed protein product [Rotaria sordida]CAF1367625.1 unnamed protein product [Rotaria sordida]CAF1609818.1 unnamed protein product [Rotaria sordida]
MRTTDIFAAFLSQFFAYIMIAASESLSLSNCANLGYASSYLKCSTCNDLKQFKLSELENSCQQCCINDDTEQAEAKKYHRAVLEVSQFPSFSVQYVRGADPVLNLFNEQDEQVESMGIEKWDTDTLTAFLEENLVR